MPYPVDIEWNVTDPDGDTTFTWTLLPTSPAYSYFLLDSSAGNLTLTPTSVDLEDDVTYPDAFLTISKDFVFFVCFSRYIEMKIIRQKL